MHAGRASTVLPDTETLIAQRVHAELRLIRQHVTAVVGSLVASSDGFLISHDLPHHEPAEIAALVATTRAVATAAMAAAGCGQFREAISRGGHGYVAVYAAGPHAVVAVIGSGELNAGLLQFQTRDIVHRIAAQSAEFGTWSGSAATTATTTAPGQLPRRRPVT